MSRGTANIEDHRLRHKGDPPLRQQQPVDSDAVRLAALASMNMARQSPGLVLPPLANVPTSYTRVEGDASALDMARSVVQLGLGSPTVWKRSNSPVHFIKAAIKQWLEENGSSSLTDNVSFDFAILEALDDNLPKREGDFFILIETTDGCGYMEIGKAIERLEDLKAGLGVSFYVVLMDTMWNWMHAYDVSAAGYFFDRWRESIEMEMADDENASPSKDEEAAFRSFCKERDIEFPDLQKATPLCLRDVSFHNERKRLKRHLAVLEAHKSGTYAELVEPVLAMAAVRQRGKSKVAQQDLCGMWDDQPLPNWVVAFEKHDPVTQAFDEEARSMQESSHAPCWIDTFNPADAKDVFRVLSYVKHFLTVNLQMVKVAKATTALSKKETAHAGTSRNQFHTELRAA